MDTDSFVLSVKTKDFIKDLKNLKNLFGFSSLKEIDDLFSIKNKKVIHNFQIETAENIWIDEFVCLRSKKCPFKCGDDSKNETKGISKSYSKHIKFDEYKKFLDGEDYQQECDIYIIRSPNHKMYLRLVQKSRLSLYDDKRCYIKNNEFKPRN